MQAGLNGAGVGLPVKDQQNISDVPKSWGPTGQGTAVGSGIYYSYPAHAATFGTNKGAQIFDVRSSADSLHQITRSDVIAELGNPGAIRYAAGTTIYMYPDGPDYQVLWVFSGGQGDTGNTVNHVDVSWPRGTVDQMAQTLPNPSIAITKTTSSYFRFSIHQAPPGYQLAELEWIPSGNQGKYVVETQSQALTNAELGVSGNVFMAINGAYRFQYASSLRGQSGKVRLVYQAANRYAIIGTSQTITLK